jgi:hypothetical protein
MVGWKFASSYIATLVFCIAVSGTVFGLVVNHIGEEMQKDTQDMPSLSSLFSVVSAMQSLWASIAIICVFLIFRGLVSISDDIVRTIFKVFGILFLFPLNIWLLVDGILILTNLNKTNNLVMNNTIYGLLIITGVAAIITCTLFLFGLVAGFLL